jgi:hypothetical protein
MVNGLLVLEWGGVSRNMSLVRGNAGRRRITLVSLWRNRSRWWFWNVGGVSWDGMAKRRRRV